MSLPATVLIIATLGQGLAADRQPPAHVSDASVEFQLAQFRQQPFFQSFEDKRAQPAAPQAPPTPQLQLNPNVSQQGTFSATDASGQRYRLVPDPYNAGWYRVEDENGRTVYQIRPGVRGPGTYETKR